MSGFFCGAFSKMFLLCLCILTYNTFNIWHAAVAYFDVVTVEQFTKLMTWEKVLFCKTLKIISDFYFDISTKWRVKPNNIFKQHFEYKPKNCDSKD